MENIELEARTRTVLGKHVRFLRREGYVPGNVYGHGIASRAIAVPVKELQRVIHKAGKSRLIDLRIDGQAPTRTLIRHYQHDPTSHGLLHVDFYAVRMGEKIKVQIPLVFVGEAPGLKAGAAVLVHGLNTVEVESLPGALPPHLEVDLSSLVEPDQAIHVRDLTVPADVTVLADPDEVVAKLAVERPEVEEVPAAEEAAAAAPEATPGEGQREGEAGER